MDFAFQTIQYDKLLPSLPKHAGVYKIFDLRDKLIVLDKTSNLCERFIRYYGERSEPVRDLDLREITGRIEYIRTDSAFETQYVLYRERKRHFPKAYRKMRTFRLFTLMKINRKQRFPRIYATRQVKTGVDYFGPFLSRAHFAKLKTTLERTFKLRPCLYNIRGNDPHPDCLYFQMHTCSRPCNNDIDRKRYLADVGEAIHFIQGRDDELEQACVQAMQELSVEMKFEEAEVIHRKLDKIQRARKDCKETYFSVWSFDYLAVLPSDSVSRCKIAFIRQGRIADFAQYEVAAITDVLAADLHRIFEGEPQPPAVDATYDEFCLVANFVVDPLQSVELIAVRELESLPQQIVDRLQQRKKKKKTPPDAAAPEAVQDTPQGNAI